MSSRLTATLILAALATPASAQTTPPAIAPANLTTTVRTLASDLFEGRAPGTAGEDRTIGYLIGKFESLGLEPGGADGGWTQPVPLLHTRLGAPTTLQFNSNGAVRPLTQSEDIYVSTLQPVDIATVAKAPLVFVGYGVTAPERGWDDFKG